jgi:hypothetical protein
MAYSPGDQNKDGSEVTGPGRYANDEAYHDERDARSVG